MRLCDLDALYDELTATIDDAAGRQVPEPFWFAADYNRAVLAAERDWLTTVLQRLESKDLSWQHRN